MRRYALVVFAALYSLCISLSASADPTPHDAQIEKVHEMVSWTQSYYTIINEIVPLFMNENINAAVSAIDTEDFETIKKSVTTYGNNRQDALANIQHRIDTMPPIPARVEGQNDFAKQYNRSLQALGAIEDTLPTMYEEMAVASGHLETLLRRVSKGDYSGLGKIAQQQNAASIRFTEAENLQAEAAITAVSAGNPNHHFQKIVLALNNVTIEELKLDSLTYDAVTTLEDRQEYNARMKQDLDKILGFIKSGKKALNSSKRAIEKEIKQTKSEKVKKFNRTVLEALDTFNETFAIEKQIYDITMMSYEEYASEKTSDEFEDIIIANDEDLAALFQRRSDIMDERLALITK